MEKGSFKRSSKMKTIRFLTYFNWSSNLVPWDNPTASHCCVARASGAIPATTDPASEAVTEPTWLAMSDGWRQSPWIFLKLGMVQLHLRGTIAMVHQVSSNILTVARNNLEFECTSNIPTHCPCKLASQTSEHCSEPASEGGPFETPRPGQPWTNGSRVSAPGMPMNPMGTCCHLSLNSEKAASTCFQNAAKKRSSKFWDPRLTGWTASSRRLFTCHCFPKGPGGNTKSARISLAPGSLLSDLLDLLVEVGTRSCHQSLHLTISGVRG